MHVATLVDSDDLIRRGKDSPKTNDATQKQEKMRRYCPAIPNTVHVVDQNSLVTLFLKMTHGLARLHKLAFMLEDRSNNHCRLKPKNTKER